MKKILTVFILILALSSVSFAKFSEGGSEVTNEPETSSGSFESVQTTSASTTVDCEEISDQESRILCRFEQGTSKSSVPEGCRVLSDTSWCEVMYSQSQTCYNDKWGIEKDQCLRDVAGFSEDLFGSSEAQARLSYEKYLLLMLYDLEYYIEEEFSEGRLNAEKSAELVSAVVDMKHQVLTKASKASVEASLAQYKTMWSSR